MIGCPLDLDFCTHVGPQTRLAVFRRRPWRLELGEVNQTLLGRSLDGLPIWEMRQLNGVPIVRLDHDLPVVSFGLCGVSCRPVRPRAPYVNYRFRALIYPARRAADVGWRDAIERGSALDGCMQATVRSYDVAWSCWLDFPFC